MKKSVISLLLAVAMVLTMAPWSLAGEADPEPEPQDAVVTEAEPAASDPEPEPPEAEPEAPAADPADEPADELETDPEAPANDPADEPTAPADEPEAPAADPADDPVDEPETDPEEPADEPEAEDDRPVIGKLYTYTAGDDVFSEDNGALLGQYVAELFRSGDPDHMRSPYSKSLPDPSEILDEYQYKLEKALKKSIQAIAQAKQTSTKVTLTYSSLNITYDDLPDEDEMNQMFQTLFLDCTYELYWFGRTVAWETASDKITFYFYVAVDYAADSTLLKVKSKAINGALTAVAKASAIVSASANLSDVEKLRAYKNEICRLTEYNFDAVESLYNDTWDGVEGPWQLVWVFDEDPATNVVCEGYAKAFEYLCNKTTFRSNKINAYCVSGNVRFYNGAGGPHMWNMVTMEDGRNYLVDVTNCDEGSTGSDRYFLCYGLSGDPDSGYIVPDRSYYPYDSDTRMATSRRSRTLATSPYQGVPGDVQITAQPQSVRVIEGEDATFTVAATGAGLSYQWYFIAWEQLDWGVQKVVGATEPTLVLTTDGTMDNRLYFCLVTGASGRRASEGAVLEVVVAPRIIEQPHDVTVKPPEDALVSVYATGTHLTYRWYFRESPEAEWRYRGEDDGRDDRRLGTRPEYLFRTNGTMDQPQVYCVVSNEAGTVSSAIATVTVLAEPTIVTASSYREVLPGETATFQVTAKGRFLTYRWYIVDPSGNRTLIEGATTDTYSVETTPDMDGYRFDCYVTNGSGEVSTSMYLHLITAPPVITQQPEDLLTKAGFTAYFKMEVEGYGLSFQWYCFDGEQERAVENGTTRWQSVYPNGQDDGKQYWCVVSNPLGSVTSRRATLRILWPPVIETNVQDVSAKPGETAVFSIGVRGEELHYLWRVKAPNAQYFQYDYEADSPTYSVPVTKDMDGYQYTCEVFNDAGRVYGRHATLTLVHVPGEPRQENVKQPTYTEEGSCDEVVYCTVCGKELSREHKIIPKKPIPVPTIITQPKDAAVKSGSKATFSLKAKGMFTVTYQWYELAPEATDWTAVEGAVKNSFSVVGARTNMGTVYRCEVRNEGGAVLSDEVTLHVTLQPPVIKTEPKDLSVKTGGKTTFKVKASGKNLTYQWFEKTAASGEWVAVEGGVKASLNVVGAKARNGAQYYCFIQNPDGEAESATVTLTVIPQPPMVRTHPKNATVKSWAKGRFTVKASGPNLTYQWFSRASETDDWAEIEGAVKAEYAFIGAMADNGRQYRCRVENEDGFYYSAEATLTVVPQPPKIGTHPKNVTVKAGAEAKFKVKVSGNELSYQWYRRAGEEDPWEPIDGATEATYAFVAADAYNGWQFCCRVRNIDGEVESKAAVLKLK